MTLRPARGPRRRLPDPGLQAERTAMAWQRTAIGMGGTSALLVHAAGPHVLAATPGLLGLAGALALLLLGEQRYAWTLRRVGAGRSPLDTAMVRATAAAAVTLAGAAAVLLLLVGR